MVQARGLEPLRLYDHSLSNCYVCHSIMPVYSVPSENRTHTPLTVSMTSGITRFPTRFSLLEFHQRQLICFSVLLEPKSATRSSFYAALSIELLAHVIKEN